MKSFHLFVYDRYYPYGGSRDYVKSFDTLEEAKSYPVSDDTWGVLRDIAETQPNGSLKTVLFYRDSDDDIYEWRDNLWMKENG